jgi:hypothetical protein
MRQIASEATMDAQILVARGAGCRPVETFLQHRTA